VPRQQRVRRHDRGDLAQHPSPHCPGLRGEPTALVVGEAQASGSELFAQDAILFLKIIDDVTLLLVDPAGERDQDDRRGCDSDGTGTAYQRPRSSKLGAPARVPASFAFLDSTGYKAMADAVDLALFKTEQRPARTSKSGR